MRRLGLAAGTALLALSSCGSGEREDAPALLDEEGFTSRVERRLRERHPKDDLRREGPLTLVVTRGPTTGWLVLGDSYEKYRAAPSSLARLVEEATERSVVDRVRETLEEDRRSVVPLVRSAAAGDPARARAGASPFHREPLAEGLVVLYQVPTEGRERILGEAEVRGAGIDPASLRPTALANLERRVPVILVVPAGKVWMVRADGAHEASLLLKEDLWTKVRIPVEGDFVAAVPAPDRLAVADSADEESVEILRVLAREAHAAAPTHVSPHLYVRRDGAWKLLPE